MHDERVVGEFTHQAETFNASEAANARETLDALIELAAPAPGQRWLEAACGPGVVARALAPRTGEVHGVDLTPRMVQLAAREAAHLPNATFAVGDATHLPDPDGAYDGAIARFTIHHVPAPARLVEELARVVKPGGAVVLADHVADDDPAAAAWAQEIERLRDPSHWASLTLQALRDLGAEADMELEQEQVHPLVLNWTGWLERGSGAAASRALIEQLAEDEPQAAEAFRKDGDVLTLRWWAARFRRPVGPSPG
jgi:ubiquinone/menaquinone biosynthesis C-methylase UbiE